MNFLKKHIKIISYFIALIFVSLNSSCVNDLDTIKKITYKSTDPEERTSDLNVFYTDSGYAKIEVFAALAETYEKPEPLVKFKDGVKVKFFDDNGEVVSVLTALYGEIRQNKGTIVVRDSVQLYNEKKKQRLETEELFWNQKDSAIFTDKAVVIRTPDALFFGKGVRTKQDFSSYQFIKPQGKINLKNQH
ncbi:MAG: LPS export ABC transporter periplasmic protein LptC [Bacteroidota bacterium]